MALECKLDGMVCSAQEAVMLREEFGDSPLLVTPGIRPSGAASNDQQRVMTPYKAICDGADYLVVGKMLGASALGYYTFAYFFRFFFTFFILFNG